MSRVLRRRPPRIAAAALSALAVGLAGAAFAGSWGVPLQGGAREGAITPAGDTDSFAVELSAGQRLKVTLTPAKGSLLTPQLTIRAPDGSEPAVQLDPRRKGLAATLDDVVQTGLYELVVAGGAATTGEYKIAARVKGARKVRLKGVSAEAREELAIPFAASGGGSLSFTVRGRTPPTFKRLEDPLGGLVPVSGDSLRSRSNTLRGRKIALPDALPFGTFRLVLEGTATALEDGRAKLDVKGPRRRRAKGRLPDAEPALTAVVPDEAGIGTEFTLHGAGFSSEKKTPLRLFLGGLEVAGPVLRSATELTATVPAGLEGRVDVALLNGDGHAPVLPDGLLVVPPPVAVSMAPVRGPAAGGTVVTILGTGFRDGAAVTVAGIPFPDRTVVVDEGRIEFTTPPFAQGQQDVAVRDPTGLRGSLGERFEFVPAPEVDLLRPALVPHRAGETVTILGRAFDAETEVSVDGQPLDDVVLDSPGQITIELPLLDVGPHDLELRDPFDQGQLLENGLTAFDFVAGSSLPGAGSLLPDALALGDYDQDGDLDVFLAAAGGSQQSASSLLTVLRNDGDGGFTNVTSSVVPDVVIDDWRADSIAIGDVAGSGGATAPDGWPDLVLGTLDEDALATGRSRIRILANQALPDGSRKFSDRTGTLMALPSQADDWKAEDLWVGDLDGDGGVPEIVATHDAVPTFVSPLTPFYVYYESGTRVFSYAQTGGRFAWQPARLPRLVGTRVPIQSLPTCPDGACEDDINPFRGRSLAVADLDQDGRMDLAVTTPGQLTVQGVAASSTQLGRNVHLVGELPKFEDLTTQLPASLNPLRGDIVLFGDLLGDPLPDLAIVSRSAASGSRALQIVENRGLGTSWLLRTASVLPAPSGAERLQAHDAELADVDGDGDLDIVLLTDASPDGGRALRILRNEGASGFTTVLTPLLPATSGGDPLDGTRLAVGDLDDDGGLGLVIGRSTDSGSGDQTRVIERRTD